MKRIYTSTLNFSKAELYSATIGLHSVGVQNGLATRLAAGTNISSFGMFGDGNNANTFYPGLTPEDYMPKPEDMVDIPMRALSATIVGAYSWKATDFRNEKVLKESVPMLDAKPIFFDHDQSVMNWLGITVNPVWQESYTMPDGTLIPAGINDLHRIDAKSNPKVARGLMMGAIGSNSVTVQFDWQPSHTYDSVEEFYNMVGMIDPKTNTMVCRQVTKIVAYHETSLVWLGADPFSKKLNGMGQPINIDWSSVQYSKDRSLTFDKADVTEKATYEKDKIFKIDFAIDEKTISLSKQAVPKKQPVLKDTPKNIQMKKFLLAFLAAFGTKLSLSFTIADDATDLTEAQVTELSAAFAKLSLVDPAAPTAADKPLIAFAKALKLVNDKGELVAFDAATATDATAYHIIPATEKVRVYGVAAKMTDEFIANEKAGADYLKLKRAEAIRFYKLTAGDAADTAVETMFNKASSEEVDGLLKQYTKGAAVKFSATCTKCNSGEHVEMRSSIPTGEQQHTTETFATKSIQEIAAEKNGSSMFIGRSNN